MINEHVALMLAQREWLGYSAPSITEKITADPVVGEPAALEARTVMFFDGISLGRLDVANEVRSKLVWKHYGKLSLRDPEPRFTVSSRVFTSLYEFFALVGFGIPSHLRNFYQASRDMYDEIKGQNELVRYKWDLVFNSRNQFDQLKGVTAGTCSYHAKKYSSQSRERARLKDDYHKDTGIDLSSLEGRLPFALQESPFLDISVRYRIPSAVVDTVLNVDAKPTAGYSLPSLVLWLSVDPRSLNPDSGRDVHRIYSITAIKGRESPFEHLLEIPGPSFPKNKRLYSTTL